MVLTYSFANLYIWRHAYEPEIAFIGERMIIRMPKYGYIFAYPKGSGDVKPIIDELLEDVTFARPETDNAWSHA